MSDALDDLLDAEDDDELDGSSNPENDQRLSSQLHKKEKEAAALSKKLEKLEADMKLVVEEKRASVVSAAAKEMGIKDKHISFYTGEPDAEAIRQWAVDNEFIEAVDADADNSESGDGFAPGGFGGNDGETPVVTGKITLDDAYAIYKENPGRFVKLASQGKVEHIDPSRTGVGQSMADVDIDFDEQYFSVPRDG